jgi:hypothetical protein
MERVGTALARLWNKKNGLAGVGHQIEKHEPRTSCIGRLLHLEYEQLSPIILL